MNSITTTLTTIANFSEDGSKRYLLTKTWEESKPTLAIIMLAPSAASGIELDNTTMLVLNNASRLGYGSVSIVNLFATLGDYSLAHAEEIDAENTAVIVTAAESADTVVYAAGVGKQTNKAFMRRQQQVLEALLPYEAKLKCLTNSESKVRFQHPLSPAVRTWYLSEMRIAELLESQQITQKEIPAQKNSKKSKTQTKKDSPHRA